MQDSISTVSVFTHLPHDGVTVGIMLQLPGISVKHGADVDSKLAVKSIKDSSHGKDLTHFALITALTAGLHLECNLCVLFSLYGRTVILH